MMCNIDDREDDHENQDKAIDQFDSEDDRSYYLNAKNVLTDCNVQTVCVKQVKQKVHFPGHRTECSLIFRVSRWF